MIVNPIVSLIYFILQLYTYVLIAAVVMSWLFAFNIINAHNQTVRQIYRAVNMLTEPVLGPIRRVLPNFGGLDFSPLVVLLVIQYVQIYLLPWVFYKVGL